MQPLSVISANNRPREDPTQVLRLSVMSCWLRSWLAARSSSVEPALQVKKVNEGEFGENSCFVTTYPACEVCFCVRTALISFDLSPKASSSAALRLTASLPTRSASTLWHTTVCLHCSDSLFMTKDSVLKRDDKNKTKKKLFWRFETAVRKI